MRKKTWTFLVLLLFCLSGTASAQVFTGATAASYTVTVSTPENATVSETTVCVGETVETGDVLATLSTEKVFAGEEGTVARIVTEEGSNVSQSEVLEIMPMERYIIYCTVSEGYANSKNRLVKCGETLYVKCTEDGTHRAIGTVYTVDGEYFNMEVTAGELYVGETVYLYRNEDCTKKQRVGIGTVVQSDPVSYTANGRIGEIAVETGDYVEIGQYLYSVLPEDGTEVTSPADGIITGVESMMTTTFTVAPWDGICIEIAAEETDIAGIEVGNDAQIIYACDPTETPVLGRVAGISRVSEGSGYTIYVIPEDTPSWLGMEAQVYIEE